MKARPSGQSLVLALAGIAAAVAVSIISVQLIGRDAAPRPAQATAEAPTEPTEESLPPSLDCAFHDFMRTRAVVSFYFDVDLSTPDQPRFYERAIVTGDGKRTNFTGNDRPAWGYALDADGKPTITSQDGANRIVLYGLKLGAAGTWPLEAGIRSNEYRNLGGECRQTNLTQGKL